jgi:poly(A) polymerase
MTLLKPAWFAEPPVQRLLAALDAASIDARFVGGCVRDTLLRLPIDDIDLATPALPTAVIAALSRARIKALPTGLDHGTVTAVVPPRHFEITTLRRDVETDGRHARVAFDAGWDEDAARRDFTINAMYLGADGTLHDPVGGRADLGARHVRFVGDPATRISEDVLRILRYYRFEARFGSDEGDAPARTACAAAVGLLPTLSAERVQRELLRLLATPDPGRALILMRDDGVLAAILPEATRLDRLEKLLAIATPTPTLLRMPGRDRVSAGGGLAFDPLLRLAALIEVDRGAALALAERLCLSTGERNRLASLAQPWPIDPEDDPKTQRLAVYRLGSEGYRDLALLAAADGLLAPNRLRNLLELAETWRVPVFPLRGDDVTALGIAPGPRVGRLLGAVRRWWEDGDFAANRTQCLVRLRELASRF